MKLTRKVTAMALASMMVFSMAACGGGDTPAETTTAAAAETTAAAAETTAAATEAAEKDAETTAEAAGGAGGNIGVCIYKFDDAFMTTYRNALQEILEGKGYTVTVMDGKNDQAERGGTHLKEYQGKCILYRACDRWQEARFCWAGRTY